MEDPQVPPDELAQMTEEATITRLVNLILSQAIADRAAAIHIEPRADLSRVLYRVDGVLYEVMNPPQHIHEPCATRLKTMANMDVNEQRIPQYGKIHLTHSGRAFQLDVCSLPSLHGEKLVLKIYPADTQALIALEHLGLDAEQLSALREIFQIGRGLLLVSGSAGTGRSTTLYACLDELRQGQRAICSIEDPVEHTIENVTQIQVCPQLGLNFAQALRSCQRSDADVIVVGELRDQECCRLAVDAACEGSLVLAGSFGYSVSSSLRRLLDLGLEPSLLARALLGILNQRLARKICPACKQLVTAPNDLQISQTWEGAGCEECRQRGHKDRLGLFELLRNSPGLAQLILERADPEQFQQQARRDGMTSLRQDGLNKVQQGLISLPECLRVLRDD